MSQRYTQDSAPGPGPGASTQLVGRLQSIRGDIQNVTDIADHAINGCAVAGVDLEELGEDDKVSELDSSLRQLLDSKRRLEMEMDLLTKIASKTDLKDIEKEYKTAWSRTTGKYNRLSDAEKFGRDAKYREFREQIWDVRHEGEPMPSLSGDLGGSAGESEGEDLVIAGARMTYKCPITATWLMDPVTSKICHHSFSREAILDYLRAHHGSCTCPVGGCAQTIRIQDIVPDKILERKLQRHLRQLEEEETSASYRVIR